jgi:hypothetical protein
VSSRRNFLILSSAAAVAAALPTRVFGEPIGDEVFTNQSLGPYQQGTVTQAHFEAVIGSPFTIFLPEGRTAWLTLRRVVGQTFPASGSGSNGAKSMPASIVKAYAAAPQLASFELHFDHNGPQFAQDSYLLDHGTMGRLAMMVGSAGTGKAVAIFASLQAPASAGGASSTLRMAPGAM